MLTASNAPKKIVSACRIDIASVSPDIECKYLIFNDTCGALL